MVAVAYSARNSYAINHDTFDEYDTFIRTYNLSGTVAGRHCAPKGRIIKPIWTHQKCIRFVTIRPGFVAVLEVEFTLTNPPVEVETLPIADKIVDGERFLFLPSLSRLAFTLRNTIQVWDAKAAKLLLKSESPSNTYSKHIPIGSFSSDGHFFAYADESGVAHVWKESPTGYVLHQKLPFESNLFAQPCLSPSGESVFMSPDDRGFHLWHTRDQVTSLPSSSANNVHWNSFTLVLSPDERFAAFAWRGRNMVTVFNLLTGDLQLTVNTDMGVDCLGITGSTLIVVGKKIITWDLPGGDCALNASINDSVRTTILHLHGCTPTHGSISPDFSRIAVLMEPLPDLIYLQIYDMSTGKCLTSVQAACDPNWVEFTRDGREVWTTSAGWKIVEDSGSGLIRLEPQDERPSEVLPPWEVYVDHGFTDDGWVLARATGKRLLWLPHHWRLQAWEMARGKRFFGMLQSEPSEIVILEFSE